jgi:hypothetical protein
MKQLLLTCVLLMLAGYLFAADFAITIDAEKDAFYTTLTGPADGWVHIPFEANNDNGSWAEHDDEIDLSANFFCSWDATYFYYYEEVKDDWVVADNGTTYNNDCLEIKFDPDPLAGPPTTGSGIFAVNMTAVDSSDVTGPLSGVDNMYPDNNGNGDIAGYRYTPGEDYARKLSDTGYFIEGRIPWEFIYFSADARGPITAAVGNIFGMAIMNHENDGDGTGRYGSIEWASAMTDAVWNNTNYLGTVTFLEGNKLNLSTMNTITGIDTNTIDYTPKNVGVVQSILQPPMKYMLSQNYPNPFNPSTTIEFSLPNQAMVTLKVYDVLGSEVAALVNEVMPVGNHRVTFNGADLTSGVYFYKLNNGQQVLTNKMMLVK